MGLGGIDRVVVYMDDGSRVISRPRKLIPAPAPEPPPEPEPPPPVTGSMRLGFNLPQYWGDCTEDGRLKPDGTLNPMFVDDEAPADVLRYMETVITNGSQVQTAGDVPQHPGWSFPEVAQHIRTMNKQRPWVNVPHLMDDAGVMWLAEQFKGTKPYVEWSNEISNTGFVQAQWAAQQAIAAGLCPSGLHVRQAAYHWSSKRTREIAAIWRTIDPAAEIIFHIGTTDPPWAEYRDLIAASEADVLTCGAYVGIESGWNMYSQVWNFTVDQGIDWLLNESLPRLVSWVEPRMDDAVRYGMPLFIYEGGQHVKGDICAWSIPAQRTEGMGLVYRDLLVAMDDIGIGLFCHYQGAKRWSGYHTFGMIEYTGDRTMKYLQMRAWAGLS